MHIFRLSLRERLRYNKMFKSPLQLRDLIYFKILLSIVFILGTFPLWREKKILEIFPKTLTNE